MREESDKFSPTGILDCRSEKKGGKWGYYYVCWTDSREVFLVKLFVMVRWLYKIDHIWVKVMRKENMLLFIGLWNRWNWNIILFLKRFVWDQGWVKGNEINNRYISNGINI